MSESNGRRRWSAAEKLRIVMAGVQAGDIAELCRREGVSPTQYYGWKKQLLAAAGRRSGRWRPWASRRGVTTAATRGDLQAARRAKLAEARRRRRETSLKLRSPTLPYPDPEGVP